MDTTTLLALVGIPLFFVIVIWRTLRRRDRSSRAGQTPLFSGKCGIKAGLEFVSPPFSRIEIWNDAIVISNPSLVIPIREVTSVMEKRVVGGPVVLIEHKQGESSPLEISLGQTTALVSAVTGRMNQVREAARAAGS